ncbi:GNAT family N-acetyltransferase [Actinoplanes siamensis]|uniref:N-acetyltransferase n=1 Tax=Actinoplanes siamensis TaxID=1223317 RepID=A0A919TPF4_9ACTN|nr:GNAT family protein [Actinoplanes siamensis]GIF09819.1 N-acetyltransferase [Actinoplanes siamensis]
MPVPWLEVVPPPSSDRAAVVSFPGHVVVAAAVEQEWAEKLGGEDFAAPSGPRFLTALEDRFDLHAGAFDVSLLAGRLSGSPPLPLTPLDASEHPRARRAHRYRTDVRLWASQHGLLVVGRGLGGRWEVAFEVDPAAQGRGHGRLLARAARHLIPEDRPIWAQCAPGNSASLRVLLAAGFQPAGSEVLLMPSNAGW